MNEAADYLPAPPSQGSATGTKPKVNQYTLTAQTLLHMEELMRRAAICSSVTDSLVASLLEHTPMEHRAKITKEQVKIVPNASKKGVASAVPAASIQLIQRDMLLGQLPLWDDHVAKARTPPFTGTNLVGPNMKEFDAKIFPMREQHSFHRGLSTHFKIPKKIAPESAAQAKASIHQSLGPPVN